MQKKRQKRTKPEANPPEEKTADSPPNPPSKAVQGAMVAGPSDQLRLEKDPQQIPSHPQGIDTACLAPLRHKLQRGHGGFDVEVFRGQPWDPTLRD